MADLSTQSKVPLFGAEPDELQAVVAATAAAVAAAAAAAAAAAVAAALAAAVAAAVAAAWAAAWAAAVAAALRCMACLATRPAERAVSGRSRRAAAIVVKARAFAAFVFVVLLVQPAAVGNWVTRQRTWRPASPNHRATSYDREHRKGPPGQRDPTEDREASAPDCCHNQKQKSFSNSTSCGISGTEQRHQLWSARAGPLKRRPQVITLAMTTHMSDSPPLKKAWPRTPGSKLRLAAPAVLLPCLCSELDEVRKTVHSALSAPMGQGVVHQPCHLSILPATGATRLVEDPGGTDMLICCTAAQAATLGAGCGLCLNRQHSTLTKKGKSRFRLQPGLGVGGVSRCTNLTSECQRPVCLNDSNEPGARLVKTKGWLLTELLQHLEDTDTRTDKHTHTHTHTHRWMRQLQRSPGGWVWGC